MKSKYMGVSGNHQQFMVKRTREQSGSIKFRQTEARHIQNTFEFKN